MKDPWKWEGNSMEKLNKETFKSKIFNYEKNRDWHFEGTRPAIVDFYADWCGPCRALTPILEELSQEYAGKVDIFKVDTQAQPELSALFNVRGIPAMLFIPVKGKPQMASGLVPKEVLKEAIHNVFGI
jgi:thioredoxin